MAAMLARTTRDTREDWTDMDVILRERDKFDGEILTQM